MTTLKTAEIPTAKNYTPSEPYRGWGEVNRSERR